MKRIPVKNLLNSKEEINQLRVCGWIRTKREGKGICFAEVNDGSSQKNIQLVVEENADGYADFLKCGTGSSVSALGSLVKSPAAGQAYEVKVSSIEILGDAPADTYPLQKKRHSFEFLREIAHLRPRTNTFGAVFRVRNSLAAAVHSFFQQNDFYWIHTPIITASDCEGAGEMFRVTTLDMKNPPFKDGRINFEDDFFGRESHLTVSGQLEGELFATALGKIYTFGPTFRAENSNTSRHLAEFWMIEPEAAFSTLEDNADLAEDFLKYIFKYVLDNNPDEMKFFDDFVQKGVINRLEKIASSSFERLSYTDAVKILETSGESFDYPVKWGIDLQSEHERYLTEKKFSVPVIVTDYPKEIKAFYMRLNDDQKTVRAMDVLVAGVGEIIGGSEREYRLDVLEKRMKEMNLDPADYWWYLDTRRFGSVPHSGFGLGFERAMLFITGMQNIRDVIPFPRTPGNALF
ncbi:MAG TPA: asparagine--tRNA ligase [Spirochaetota bacterium]|nr:asparagine--tRNA ligase [Spirochaetota bacterium]HOR44729.1 asparagine--tRNA ligase [Spirochaetota bacterium]HPK56249.1 asparagine--tRNA ligase [Spirochaetota bacterium]